MSRGPDAATLLIRAIGRDSASAGCPVEVTASDWTKWASATFTGARHVLTLTALPSTALDRWLAELPETQFDLRGHLVADLAVAAVKRCDVGITIGIEALTVEQ